MNLVFESECLITDLSAVYGIIIAVCCGNDAD